MIRKSTLTSYMIAAAVLGMAASSAVAGPTTYSRTGLPLPLATDGEEGQLPAQT
jgi:hypothetical protein